jgi:hypothetical protein
MQTIKLNGEVCKMVGNTTQVEAREPDLRKIKESLYS